MSTSNSSMTEYSIETRLSAGSIKDPVTGEAHEIDSHGEDKRGGIITVSRPDSAHYLVENDDRLTFVSEAPSQEAVQEAQAEALGFEPTEPIREFSRSHRGVLGTEELVPSKGFDPAEDACNNGAKLRVAQAYQSLNDEDRPEAVYLRGLTSFGEQQNFVSLLQEGGHV